MTVRVAHPADAEAIALLHADSWKRTYRGMFRDEFLDGDVVTERRDVWKGRCDRERLDQLVLVAEADGRLIGFICAYGDEDPEWGSLIDNLHVAAGHQGRGIGRRLLAEAGTWLAASYPGRGIHLWALEANGPARRFYERLGATQVGVVAHPSPGGGSAPNCRYVWPSADALTRSSHSCPQRQMR